MKKRWKAAAAAAMALAMLGGALPVLPGGAELLNTPLTAHAAGSVTLDEETGTLYLDGAVTREDILAYREPVYKPYMDGYIPVYKVESVVANEGCILPEDCSELFQQAQYDTYEAPGDWYFAIIDWCNLSSIDLSKADTSNVKDMRAMFKYSNLTSLDLSSFDTSNVTNMDEMFYYCNSLETIYVSDLWNTDAVTRSSRMFNGSTKLKGGDGTVFDENHTDKEYARIDGKDGKPGYLTYKEYKCPGSYVKGVSLGLADQIGVTFYVNMKDQVKKAVLSGVPGEVTVTNFNQITSGDYKGCVKLVYPVNATEARRRITLRLYDKDGNQLPLYNSGLRRLPDNTVQFSVQDYLEQAPTYYPNNEKAQKLAAALGNYCMAACNYFCATEYKIAGIQDVTADSFSAFKAPLNGLKIALVLNSQTELRVYGIGTTENYTARNGQLPDLIYDAEGGYHKITGITPKKLVNGEEYLINGEYVAVSPLTYGYYVMNNSDDKALKTVVRALFVYAKTAWEY